MNPLNSILQSETTFPSEIMLHLTVSGLISDIKTMKQELGRLSGHPPANQGFSTFCLIYKESWGTLGEYWESSFVCHLLLPARSHPYHQHFKNTTSWISGRLTNWTGKHSCYCVNNFV